MQLSRKLLLSFKLLFNVTDYDYDQKAYKYLWKASSENTGEGYVDDAFLSILK